MDDEKHVLRSGGFLGCQQAFATVALPAAILAVVADPVERWATPAIPPVDVVLPVGQMQVGRVVGVILREYEGD